MWVQRFAKWAEADDDGTAGGVAGEQAPESAPEGTAGDETGAPTLEDAISAALSGGDEESAGGEEGAVDGAPGGEPGEPEPAEGKGEGEEAAGGEGETPGVLSDADLEPPKGTKAETRERFQKLATGYRELRGQHDDLQSRLEQVTEQHNTLVDLVRDTGASNDEFATTLHYMRLVHSDEPDDARAALAILDAEREALAKRIGIKVEGVDVLADYPDLREKVDNLDIDEETALELAAARRERARFEQRTTQQRQQQTADAERGQAVEQGKTALNEWDRQMQARSLDYAKIKPLFVEELPDLARLPPDQWVPAAERIWKRIERTMQAVAGSAGAGRRPPSPISGGSRAAGGDRPPKTMDEAIARTLDGSGA